VHGFAVEQAVGGRELRGAAGTPDRERIVGLRARRVQRGQLGEAGATYYRLGGTRKVTVDVRVIAATNRDLDQAVSQGYFRSDLYYRLNQIDVHVPPLRERIDDVLPLADFFLKQTNRELRISPEAARKLCAHHWPGNVRELRNVIIKAAMAAGESEIEVHHLPAYVMPARSRPTLDAGDLDSLERAAIFNALEKSGGHQQRAADLLGISRRTLSRKLKTYAGSGDARYA
jgi:two-component system NtrC family response regulator